jgi:hypothetical protein
MSNLNSKESDATPKANLDMSVQNVKDSNRTTSMSNNTSAALVIDTSMSCWECGESGHSQYNCDRYIKRKERAKLRNKDKKCPIAKEYYNSKSNKSSSKSPNKRNYKGKHFNKDYNKKRKFSDDDEEDKPSKKAKSKKQGSDDEDEHPKISSQNDLSESK